jgi:DNA-binding NtrC family response regulator
MSSVMNDGFFVVSGDAALLEALESWGPLEGAPAFGFANLQEAYGQLEAYDPLLLLLDRRSETGSILGLIRKIRRKRRNLELILLESPRSDKVRRSERQAGVDRFIDLPLPDGDLKLFLERRIRLGRFRQDCKITGKSEALEQILEMVMHIAPTDISVLITGESGTGKELIAQTLHQASKRKGESFLALNCGALPEGTLESELFGHEKGAFTGAVTAHPGHFERADGGTLFLDEIGEMSHQIQIRLLRVLETGEFIRMGGLRTQAADVRVVAATNRDLDLEVREGRFRRDLLHRIKVFEVRMPPLRERPEDVPLLVEQFLREIHAKEGTALFQVDQALMDVLGGAPWPGNIRELRNLVQRMAVMARGGKLGLDDLPADFIREQEPEGANLPVPMSLRPEEAERELLYRSILALREDMNEVLEILRTFEQQVHGETEGGEQGTGAWGQGPGRDLSRAELGGSLEEMEQRLILQALEENRGHRRRAARQLGISERTLYRKLKEYGLG